MDKVGVIDIGSNSIKLDIFSLMEDGKILNKIRYRSSRSLEGNFENGSINEENMNATLETIDKFVNLCRREDVKNIVAVATESIRKAKNKDKVLKEVKKLCDIDINIITGEQEAHYVFKGVKEEIDINEGILIDIGGGSTEIIYFKDNSIMEVISLPIGARTMTKKFELKDLITDELENELEGYLIKEYFSKVKWLANKNDISVIGSGGTMKNLAKLINHNLFSCIFNDDNFHFNRDDVEEIHELIKNKSIQDLKDLKGVSDRNLEVVKGGAAILLSFLKITNIHSIIVSNSGIREGILREYLEISKDY
jgi:exopolyphosphatase/guanosine-5'-triphosphate,3'-diphosphate pyrophosphatase